MRSTAEDPAMDVVYVHFHERPLHQHNGISSKVEKPLIGVGQVGPHRWPRYGPAAAGLVMTAEAPAARPQ